MGKKILSLLAFMCLASMVAMAQPANDTPCNATSFGSLPNPGPCTAGLEDGATVTFNNLTSVGATGASPYVYLTGCSGGGQQAAPALDVWYSFTATGASVNLAIAGFPSASVAIWTGTCNNLTGVGCLNVGNGGSGSFTVTQTNPGQTYWIQVSGNSQTATDNNFSLTLDNDNDCNDCLQNATLTASPPPVNGGYVANQTVTFCYTVDGWDQVNTNWFHGVQITFGAGWTGGIQNPVPATTLQNIPGPGSDGDWLFYPTGIGNVNGNNWGPGFYFDTPDAGTAASNNYGDDCDGAGCTWTFCWDMTVGACSPGTSLAVTVNTSGDGESGSWQNNGCNDDNATNFVAVEICCSPPTMTQTNVTCPGGTNGTATATGIGASPWDYVWSTGATANNVAGSHTITGLAPGTYTVTVTDNTNCTSTNTVTITAPAAITATPTVVNVLCNGGSTGSITMGSVSGGTPGYQYSLNGGPFQASNVFSGLPAGTYTVTIRDNAGCLQTFTNIVITQPAPLTGVAAVVNVLCNGASTGSITINNVTGGVGPYQYSLNGGPWQGSNVFSGLPAGTYTVTIRDANLCTRVITNITITQPAPITGTPAVVNVLCNGGTTGSITINGASGGVGPYQYSLNGGPFQASNVFSGLAAGTYTVTIRDANLCTVTLTNIVVTQPAAITGTPAVVNVLCNGGTTGSITINGVSGGTPGYQYSLNGGPWQASNVFSGLAAGTFTVTIRDVNLCTVTLTNIVVTQPAAITATAAVVNVLCNGGSTGSITINGVSGGTPGYQYSLNGGPWQASNVFSGLTAGTYTVTVRDVNLCTYVITNIVVTQPAPIAATAAVVDVLCNGGNTGSITINNVTGGNGVYQYSLNGGPYQAGNVFSGLTAGTYTVTVRDGNGCTFVINNIVVGQPTALGGTASSTPATCSPGNDGTITVNTATGGAGGYQYSIGGPFQAGTTFTGLSGGSYTVTIRDANGCTFTIPVTVTIPGGVSGSAAVINVTCNGGSNGQVVVTASSSNPPIQYSLNGGPQQLSNTFSGLSAGPYSITATDNAGCSIVLTGTVGQPAAITGTPAVVNVLCNGGSTGSITINGVSGGTPGYQYSLNGGAYQASNTFGGLAAGTYTVTIQDQALCTTTLTNIVVSEPAAISATAAATDVLCNGGNTGTITINNVTGGNGSYQYSLNGGPYQASNVFTGLVAGTYSVTVRDGNGCTFVINNIVVSEPAVLAGTATSTPVTCSPGNDGTITVTSTTGGAGGYQYSIGGPFQAGTTFGGLGSGSYTVTIRDVNGCTTTIPVTIGVPGGVTASATVTDVTCNAGTNGQIVVTANSSDTPIQYSLNGGPQQLGNTFTGLSAGPYSITVTDNAGCTVVLTGTIGEPAAITASTTTTGASCSPGADGSITVVGATGGTSPYQYSINAGPLQASNVFNGLSGGVYTVLVQDFAGCTFTTSATVTSPGSVTGTATATDVSCNGGNNGTITVNGTSANPPLQYSLNAGPLQSGNVFSGLIAGTYTITIQDGLGCTYVTTAQVNEPNAIIAADTSLPVTCNGGSDGEIQIIGATGGTPGYQYQLGAGPWQASNTFSGLAAGTYTVTIQDQNLCTATFANIVVTEPTAIAATDSMIPASCTAGNDGQIWVVNVNGGTPGYQYSLNGGALQASNGFTGLIPGTYTVLVQDQNGCQFTFSSTVTQPGGLTATDSIVNPTCFGFGDGEIWINTSGGAAPIQFSLNGGPAQGGNFFTGLGGGAYTVLVTDQNGCEVTLTGTLVAPALITGTLTGTEISCFGGNDGSVTLNNTAGGTPGYQYSLNGGPLQAGSTFSGLVAGTYSITVQDANGCTAAFGPLTIGEPSQVVVLSANTDVACNGGNDGALNLTGFGGTPNYEFSIDGVNFQSSSTFNGLPAGIYTITVRDGNGCTATTTDTISEPSALQLATSSTPALCGNADGTMTVTVSGGTLNYSYLWLLGGGNTATTATVNNVTPGTFTVIVTDGNGCADTTTATVAGIGGPVVDLSTASDPNCFGESTGYIVANVTSGTAPFSYLWTPGGSTTDSIGGLPSGSYTVVVTDDNGCQDSATTLLRDPALFLLTADTVPATCFGTNDGSITLNPTGGTPGYTVNWNTGSTDLSLTGLSNGNFTAVVSDANGCTDSISFTFVEPREVTAAFISNPEMPAQFTIENGNVTFTNQSINASTFFWEFGDGDTSSAVDPTHLYTLLGTYCVTLTAFDTTGCGDTVEVCAFTVVQEPLIIPNTFTPNDDGVNDNFVIEGLKQYPNNKLMIFNRWGNLVYESTPYNNDWNGRHYRDGKPLPDGGYFYILETGVEGQENFQGDVVIFR